jgi:hypothetical protein
MCENSRERDRATEGRKITGRSRVGHHLEYLYLYSCSQDPLGLLVTDKLTGRSDQPEES